jgi:hypothetical protein
MFAVEFANNRVSEFTPWGEFVKAFGYDVAPGAVNEEQEVRVRATSGQFRLTFSGDTTGDLPFDAPSAGVEAALSSLPSIGSGGVSVRSVPGSGSSTPYVHVVTFEGALAGTNVALLVAADGSSPLEGGNAPELEVRTRAEGTAGSTGLESCTEGSGCKAGIAGSGPGQIGGGLGLTVDQAGNIYVKELANLRVQKFDSSGRFVWMAGGEVDKTTSANLCTEASGNICGAGVSGTGPGEFSPTLSEGIAFCPASTALCALTGAVHVADNGRIQQLSLDGVYEDDLSIPGTVQGLAFDAMGEDFYTTDTDERGVRKWNGATGAEIPPVRTSGGRVIAVNEGGELFASHEDEVLEYDPDGNPLVPPTCCKSESQPPPNQGQPFTITGLGTNGAGNLHVAYAADADSFIRVFGPGPVQFEGPPPMPPQISAQFASAVQRDGASVAAMINPRFFTDTTYRVQYGTSECSSGGCTNETAPQELTKKVFGSPVRSPGVFLEGLTPGTTYHYRFVAQSSGGGPTVGDEATFTTPDLLAKPPCPNDVFRGGASARLPDCRAYEMVSPVDKNNGDIKSLLDFISFETKLGQASPDGERLTYSSSRSFGAPKGAPLTNQYLARRVWESAAISPAQGPGADVNANPNAIGNPFKLFSKDLCTGWFVVSAEPLLDPPRDFRSFQNVYRRDLCGGAPDEALLPLQPSVAPREFTPEPLGASADGKAAIVRVKGLPLAASNRWQTYFTHDGEIAPLCVLPGGAQASGNCSGGTGTEKAGLTIVDLYRQSNVNGAISDDGSHVYWTDTATEKESGTGTLYLRINPGAEEESASGCEEGKACTVPVLGTVTTNPAARARFLQANPEGTKALFEVTEGGFKGNLYLYDAEAGSSRTIAGGLVGLAAAGEDFSRVYFVSRSVLSGTSGAVAGQPNLYLDEGGTKTFIATLSEDDVSPADVSGKEFPSNTALGAIFHAARASADGGELAFISNRSLSGYDNTDLITGQPDSEVYLYEAGAEDPVCVSCNPSGQRPRGEPVKGNGSPVSKLAAAALLPVPENMYYTPRALSDDGERLFFESFDPLLPRDVNGAKDVYEWESAASKAECAQRGADLYVSGSGGCLSLISSGEGPEDSEFVDASTSGNDVFFITNSSLLPQDPGLFDVYDARVNGGLPLPPPPVECQGETCKPPITAPNDPTPASSSYSGPGDLEEKAKKKKKKKAKKKKKSAKKGKGKKKAAQNGRAGR